MAETFRKYGTAKKKADGLPVVRIADLYIAGVTAMDEITIFPPDHDAGSAHITMRHLDRLGNGNHAIAVEPHGRKQAYGELSATDRERIGLAMGVPEAMALWSLLDRALAGQPMTEADIDGEKLRWTRDRLARLMMARNAPVASEEKASEEEA
jgi:hypothetical protein